MTTTSEKPFGISRMLPELHSVNNGPGNDDDSGCATEEYAWIPPGVTPDQV